MSAEFGVWSDAAGGFVEAGFWLPEGAEAVLPDYRKNDDTAYVREVCPDHEEQPVDACEDCEDDDA